MKRFLKFLGEYTLSIVILLAGIVLFLLFFYYDFRTYGSPFYLRLSEFLPVSYYLLVFLLVFLFFSVVYLSIMAIRRRLTILEELSKLKTIDSVTKDILKVEDFGEKLKIFGQGIVDFLGVSLVGVFVSAKDGFKVEFVSERNKEKRDYLFSSIEKNRLMRQ